MGEDNVRTIQSSPHPAGARELLLQKKQRAEKENNFLSSI